MQAFPPAMQACIRLWVPQGSKSVWDAAVESVDRAHAWGLLVQTLPGLPHGHRHLLSPLLSHVKKAPCESGFCKVCVYTIAKKCLLYMKRSSSNNCSATMSCSNKLYYITKSLALCFQRWFAAIRRCVGHNIWRMILIVMVILVRSLHWMLRPSPTCLPLMFTEKQDTKLVKTGQFLTRAFF